MHRSTFASLAPLLLSAGLLAAAPAASAATVMTATYTGTLLGPPSCSQGSICGGGSQDMTGVFGQVSSNLGGEAFTLTFTYDLSQAADVAFFHGGERADGGAQFGGGAFGTGSITVNGETVTWVGDDRTTLSQSSDPFSARSEFVRESDSTRFGSDLVSAQMSFSAGRGVLPLSLTTPFSLDLDPTDAYTDLVSVFSETLGVTTRQALLSLAPTHLSVTRYDDPTLPPDQPPVDGGVPEPGVWALLAAGFGLTGGVLRRRRGAVAAV